MGLPKQAPVTHWSVLPVISQVVGSAAHFDGIRVPSAKRIKLLLRARPNTQSPLRAWSAEWNIGRRALRRSSATEAASVSRHDAASQSPTVPSLWTSHNTHLSLTPFSIIPAVKSGPWETPQVESRETRMARKQPSVSDGASTASA